jgi:DNA-directed RNA polymerase subunit RPC12/RpoP
MAEPVMIQCPGCKARLKVATVKPAIRCPKCGGTVPVKAQAAEPDEDDVRRPVSTARVAKRADADDERPARASRRRRDEEEEDERPARGGRRRRDEEDDEEEEERPRARRGRRRAE